MEENNEKLNPYVVPAAIVVAGLLIAGAVVYVGGSPSGSRINQQTGDSDSALTPTAVAEAVGVRGGAFDQCLAENRYADRVSEDMNEAFNVGVGGTPTSVVVTPAGEQYFLVGAQETDVIGQYVDAALLSDDAVLGELEAQYGIRGVDGVLIEADDVREVSGDDHVRGNLNAPVKIIEYSDLECPYCERFHPEMKDILEQYGDDVAWVYRHLPLEQIHPLARPLAEGSECAAEIGGEEKFWEYIDYVFES